ncbi:MAG: histidine kinase [bacterium]
MKNLRSELWTSDGRRLMVDWLPAIGLLVLTQVSIWVQPTTLKIPGPQLAATVLYFAMAISLGFRRSAPIPALGMALAVGAWEIFRESDLQQGSFESFVSLCLATYAIGAYSHSRKAVIAGLLLPALIPIGDTIHRHLVDDTNQLVSEVLPYWIWAAAICLIGRGVRDRHILIGRLGERADRLEREREEKARAAVAEERARIARELHDVVAHGVSVMVVQAGAARRVLHTAPAQAEQSLLAVEATGRQSLAEMRRLLGVLRTDSDSLTLAPQPGLGRVDDLVERVRGAGLPVELHSEGESRDLPIGVDLVAYRVIQEGLTNVLKHAGQARATVTIGYRQDCIDLEVRDDGKGKAAQTDGRGHGLFGMRERVGLYGGRVHAESLETGGFVVRATIPTAEAL